DAGSRAIVRYVQTPSAPRSQNFSGFLLQNSPRPRRPRRFHRLRDLLSPFPRRGHGVFWSSSTKLSACSAISAFRSSPRSLVPAAASRRRRTPRRTQNAERAEVTEFSGFL